MDQVKNRRFFIALCAIVAVFLAVICFLSNNNRVIDFLSGYLNRKDMISAILMSQSLMVLAIPAVLFPKMVLGKSNREYWEVAVPFLILAAFVVTNMQILIMHDFQGIGNLWDYKDFTDFQELTMYTPENVYFTNYPPLAVYIYVFASKFVPDISKYDYENSFNYISFMFNFITCFSLYFIITRVLEKYRYKEVFAIAALLSGPVIFALERENLIVFALIFTLLFLLTFEDERLWMRLLSYLFLAIAANIKMYPAVFGALLLKKKRYKGAAISFGLGLLLFTLPSLFVWGQTGVTPIQSFASFFVHVSEFSDINYFTSSFWSMGMKSLGRVGLTGLVPVFELICIAASLVCFFVADNKANELMLLSILCICTPRVAFWYSLIFLLIPLMELLRDDSGEFTKVQILQLVMILLMYITTYDNRILGINRILRLTVLFLATLFDVIMKEIGRNNGNILIKKR